MAKEQIQKMIEEDVSVDIFAVLIVLLNGLPTGSF